MHLYYNYNKDNLVTKGFVIAAQYREIERTSWGKRLTSAISGVLFGILLFFGSFALIWWNEGRSVDRIKTLDQGRDQVVSVPSDRYDPSLRGQLLHMSGPAVSNEVLADPLFGVQDESPEAAARC